MNIKKLNKVHTQQLDQADCGVAALLAVLKYHDAKPPSVERLREMSGTQRTGTTMLGLLQAANKLGLIAKGFEADLKSLSECEDLCILHIIKDQHLQHYVVFYGYDAKQEKYLIGDPASQQVDWWTKEQLEEYWQSKSLLLFKAGPNLVKQKELGKNQWYWIRELIKPDLNLLGIAFAIGIIIATLGLATAIFSQKLLDDILPSGDRLRLFSGAGLLLILLLFRSGMAYIRGLFLLKQTRAFNVRIIDHFFGRLLQLPKSFFDNRKTGDLIARMNDTQRIQQTIARIISGIGLDVLLVLVSTGAVFYYSWEVGVIAIAWIPVFSLIVLRYHPQIVNSQQALMGAYANNESHFVDTIQGIGVIKVNNKQPFFKAVTTRIYNFFQQSIFNLGKISIGFHLATELVSAIFIVAVITWSSVQVLNQQISTGSMIAILQMIGILMGGVANVARANIDLQEARIAFNRMYEFTSIESEYEEEEESPKVQIHQFEELRVNQLSFRFPGRPLLLKEISFKIHKGEWLAILGESGCGKSTLLQILQKFYPASGGYIKVNGTDLDMIAFESWRSMIGVVPQQIKLFNGTLLDNILLGSPITDPQRLEGFFKEYGFDAYFQKFPNGYATILGESGINISGGQQQMVALARALYHQPQVLFLDEPTAAMDRNTEQFVLNLLERIKENTAIVMLTHRLRTARAADRIGIIENGVIVQKGKHEDLIGTDNLYAKAWQDLVMN